jgi:hypothetical protein
MLHFAALFFLIVLGMGVLTWATLPSAGKRVIAVGAFVMLTIAALGASVESAGQPKPLLLEWRDVHQQELVGLAWDEDRHIVWAWVMADGQPVAYSLPWPEDKKQMGELQDRWRRRGVSGDEFTFTGKGDIAEVTPPKPNPEKTQ